MCKQEFIISIVGAFFVVMVIILTCFQVFNQLLFSIILSAAFILIFYAKLKIRSNHSDSNK